MSHGGLADDACQMDRLRRYTHASRMDQADPELHLDLCIMQRFVYRANDDMSIEIC